MVWIYNNFSKKIIKLEPSVAEQLKKNIFISLEIENPLEYNKLLCNGMICEDDKEETEFYIKNLLNF